jgi:hypothetical protein
MEFPAKDSRNLSSYKAYCFWDISCSILLKVNFSEEMNDEIVAAALPPPRQSLSEKNRLPFEAEGGWVLDGG